MSGRRVLENAQATGVPVEAIAEPLTGGAGPLAPPVICARQRCVLLSTARRSAGLAHPSSYRDCSQARHDAMPNSQGCWRGPSVGSTLARCVPPAPRLDRYGLHIGGADDQFE